MDIDNSYIRCSSSCYCCIFKVSLLIYELNSFRCGMIRALIEAIDQYKGEDPLQPWLQWVLFFWNKIGFFRNTSAILFFTLTFLNCLPSYIFYELCIDSVADIIFSLKLWRCIKWVQESFPPGGDSSGLIVIYEQCVRTFWHDERYKDDLRYLKTWLEYVRLLSSHPFFCPLISLHFGIWVCLLMARCRLKTVWMLKSSIAFWRLTKLGRHILHST